MPRKPKWNPPYLSTKVQDVYHWMGKPVEWPASALSMPNTLENCLAVLCPVYDVMVRRIQASGDLYLFVDDLGKGFRTR
jgi:hypothetical protein